MAEGGTAEKFPDEWDLQFLGNSILNQLSSGISPDFLIERYTPFFFYYLFYYYYCIYIYIYFFFIYLFIYLFLYMRT